MKQERSIQPFRKKFAYDLHQELPNQKPNLFETPSKHSTIEFQPTEPDISHANFSIESSRIAEETSQVSAHHPHLQHLLRQKMECLEVETAKLIEKKDRDIYFLRVEMENYQIRLNEAESLVQQQNQEIKQLRDQIKQINTQNNSKNLQEEMQKVGAENRKLKESLEMLIAQKNESWKAAKKEYMTQNAYYSHNLKREIEDLRAMVAEMEDSIKNCPSCFSLRRENQELAEAYNHLKKLHSELTHKKNHHEKTLLQNITAKIQENQNIVRQNLQLKQQRGSSQLRSGRQRLKESVAKRCRTLTDQF